jgi:hypothetical protein
MNINTKLEVALEVIAAKIAKTSNKGYGVDDEEMKLLIKERQQMYAGNEQVIDKIINLYGPEIKNDFEGAKK